VATGYSDDIENEIHIAKKLSLVDNRRLFVEIFRCEQVFGSPPCRAVYLMDMELCLMTLHDFVQHRRFSLVQTVDISNSDSTTNLEKHTWVSLVRLQLDVLLPIIKNVLDAICFLHEMELIHRDIKPENSTPHLVNADKSFLFISS
jgi:serine/threonine protein kinase